MKIGLNEVTALRIVTSLFLFEIFRKPKTVFGYDSIFSMFENLANM